MALRAFGAGRDRDVSLGRSTDRRDKSLDLARQPDAAIAQPRVHLDHHARRQARLNFGAGEVKEEAIDHRRGAAETSQQTGELALAGQQALILCRLHLAGADSAVGLQHPFDPDCRADLNRDRQLGFAEGNAQPVNSDDWRAGAVGDAQPTDSQRWRAFDGRNRADDLDFAGRILRQGAGSQHQQRDDGRQDGDQSDPCT